jgi:glucan phosphoethanolaminetransferase (alkaline phosphatase superfamily)
MSARSSPSICGVQCTAPFLNRFYGYYSANDNLTPYRRNINAVTMDTAVLSFVCSFVICCVIVCSFSFFPFLCCVHILYLHLARTLLYSTLLYSTMQTTSHFPNFACTWLLSHQAVLTITFAFSIPLLSLCVFLSLLSPLRLESVHKTVRIFSSTARLKYYYH